MQAREYAPQTWSTPILLVSVSEPGERIHGGQEWEWQIMLKSNHCSWNKSLSRKRSEFMHKEFRVKGANVALGPGKSYLVFSRSSPMLTRNP